MFRTMHRRKNLLRLALVLAILLLALLAASCGGSKQDVTSTTAAATASTSATTAATSAPASTAGGESTDTTGGMPATSDTTLAATETTNPATSTSATAAPGQVTTTIPAPPTTAKATTTTAKATTTTAAPSGPVVLTVSGPSGTKKFSMADLKAMTAVSGYGGYKNQAGTLTPPDSYTGVSLRSLMQLVGGSGGLTVVASDSYTITMSAAEAAGQVAEFGPATGDSISGVAVTVIVAYAKNGGGLGGDGPLKIAFVSPGKNQLTTGNQWAKMVVELRCQ